MEERDKGISIIYDITSMKMENWCMTKDEKKKKEKDKEEKSLFRFWEYHIVDLAT